MASAWRVPLLLSLSFGVGYEVLAGSRTVPVQVTFVDVARHSASQSLTVSQDLEPGRPSPRFMADLRLNASETRPLSIIVEAHENPRGLRGTLACVPNAPVGSTCGGRLADSAGSLTVPRSPSGSGAADVESANRPANDLIVTITYH